MKSNYLAADEQKIINDQKNQVTN